MTRRSLTLLLATGLTLGAGADVPELTGAEVREAWLEALRDGLRLSPEQIADVRTVLAGSRVIGTGNPTVTRHPGSVEACRGRRAGLDAQPDLEAARICGSPHMAPLYDPARQQRTEARVCIDRFEFPGLPCSYPLVWVRAREAAQLCAAVGKRLCDAHEWEGACDGALLEPDYDFEAARGLAPGEAVARLRQLHNRRHAAAKRWAYGPEYRRGVCAASAHKSPGCEGGEWARCGSNTWPAGSFPECVSVFGVYDLHGNAAEHMNLPLAPEQMAGRAGEALGYTEMKGSWFIFDHYRAHEDWCRWRAPYWHGSRVMDRHSHHNYHLGFRCCRSVEPQD